MSEIAYTARQAHSTFTVQVEPAYFSGVRYYVIEHHGRGFSTLDWGSAPSAQEAVSRGKEVITRYTTPRS